jgi:hypothetical protein
MSNPAVTFGCCLLASMVGRSSFHNGPLRARQPLQILRVLRIWGVGLLISSSENFPSTHSAEEIFASAPEFTRWHHGRGGKVGSAGSKRIGKKELEMRLLYIITKGTGDPTLASVPLHIAANGSLDIGQEVSVVLAGDATDLVIEDNMQRLEGVGVPPARELLGKLKEQEVPVYV